MYLRFISLILACVILCSTESSAEIKSVAASARDFRYNRVEGLHLGFNRKLFTLFDGSNKTSVRVGYGFKSEEVTYGISNSFQIEKFKGLSGTV